MDGTAGPADVELITAIEQGRRVCERANLDLLAAYERLERLGPAAQRGDGGDRGAGAGGHRPAGRPAGGGQGHHRGGGRADPLRQPGERPRAAADAEMVRRLRAAGAEVFATTQCLEYAAGFANPEIGDTRNPHDPSRTSGGSSGGSAALVAAGVCDLAIGTDTGGSIRIPAAYCGIVGLKPTYGLLPLDGVFPLSPSCDHAGTLTATVAGAADLLLSGRPADCWPAPGRPASGRASGPDRAAARATRPTRPPWSTPRPPPRLRSACWPRSWPTRR